MVRGAKLNNSSSNRRHPALMTQIRTCLALLAISHFMASARWVAKSSPTTALAFTLHWQKPLKRSRLSQVPLIPS